MKFKVIGGVLAAGGLLAAAAPGVYTIDVDRRTGRLVRVPARRVTRVVASRPVPPTVVREKVVAPRAVEADRLPLARRDGAPEKPWDELIESAAWRHGIRPSFVHAVIKAESNYNPFAVSSKGAAGLMQLTPETAARFGVRNRFDPAQNIEGGVRYLRHLLDLYDGQNGKWHLALAAYNAGEGAVDRYRGIPPYPETRSFVPRVVRYYSALRSAERAPEPLPAPKKFEGPRIFRVTEPSGFVRYTTEGQ